MKRSRFIKPVLLIISTLTVMSGATIAPSLPAMAAIFSDVPNSTFLSKLLLTLPALAIALVAPVAGVLVDRLGRLKVLHPALVLYALAGSLGYFVHDLYWILVSRFFLGVAVACIMTVAITLIGDYFEGEERMKFIGFQASFMSLGGAVFVSVGGFLADLHWSYPFLIYLTSLAVLVGSYMYLFEPQKEEKTNHSTIEVKPNFRSVLPVLVVAFVSMVAFYMLPVQIPFALRDIDVTDSSLTGIAISVATLVATVTSLFYGYLRKSKSIAFLFAALFFLMGIGFYLVSISESYLSMIAAMAVVGIGMGLLMPNLNTWLLNQSNEFNRGTHSGWLSASLFLGQFISPIATLPIIEVENVAYAFMVGAILLLLLGAIFFSRINRAQT